MSVLRRFLNEEDGAVTIEWVALSAGVVLVALLVANIMSDGLNTTTSNIAGRVDDAASALISSYSG